MSITQILGEKTIFQGAQLMWGKPAYYTGKLRQLPGRVILQELQWKFERRRRQRAFQKQITAFPPRVSSEHGRRILGEQGFLHLPPFFLSPQNKEAYRKAFKRYFSPRQVITEAEAICQKRFYLLGRQVDLSQGIDWQRDFFSGHRWDEQKRYFPVERVIAQIQLGQGVDVKVPWELSRLQFGLVLGQAYWLSEDEKYAQAFVDLLKDWLAKNPPYSGINWCSPMETGIRAANLIWGLYFFSGSPALEDDFAFQLVSLLHWHGQFIYANLEKWFESTGNHYLANLAGLIYLGIFLKKQEWLDFAKSELARQMLAQVLEDGVDFEASIGYHRLALECFFYPAWLCRLNNIGWPESFWEKLKQMFAYTQAYLKPNGRAPQLGDNDSGRLHCFGRRSPNDHTYLPAIASLAFGGQAFTAGAAAPEALWIFGPGALADEQQKAAAPPLATSREFPRAGVYIMRNPEGYMLISCGPNGFYDKGCHAHNDKLSFVLNYRGQDFIVDPGSYLYTPDAEERNRFRSTAYHNTVRVDEREQNRFEPGEPFFLHADSHPRALKWQLSPEQDIFCGRHDGYARLPQPVIHQRRIVFDKKRTSWQISDTLEGAGEHLLEWFLHLAPGVEAEICAENEVALKQNGVRLIIHTPAKPELNKTYYSPEYGVKVPTRCLYWSSRVELPFSSTLLIQGEG